MLDKAMFENAHSADTITGLDHVDGTGIVTYVTQTEYQYETGIEIMAVLGTETMTDVGTQLGTFVYCIIAADGDETIVIIQSDGSDETHEIGTITGLDQVVGTTTETGT